MSAPIEPQRLYKPGEIAEKFHVAGATASRWIAAGKFPREHIVTTAGGHHRVNADYIDALLRGESS